VIELFDLFTLSQAAESSVAAMVDRARNLPPENKQNTFRRTSITSFFQKAIRDQLNG
jgi:hypothetical protein